MHRYLVLSQPGTTAAPMRALLDRHRAANQSFTLEAFMAAPAPQSFARHKQYVTGFHWVTGGLVLLTLVLAVVGLVRTPGLDSLTVLCGAAALAGVYWYTRAFPLGVQDRVICLEERLRLGRLLPPELAVRVGDFRPSQLIALRFASDVELPALAERVLMEGITSRTAIKALIRDWRADTRRI